MVKIMENPIKMDDLGGTPLFFGNTHLTNLNNHDILGGFPSSRSLPQSSPTLARTKRWPPHHTVSG